METETDTNKRASSRHGLSRVLSRAAALKFNRRSKTSIGIVVEDHYIDLVVVRRESAAPVIVARKHLDKSGAAFTSPMSLSDSLLTMISEVSREIGLVRPIVNVALLVSESGFRRVDVPDMPSGELRVAAVWEAKKLFPFDLDNSILDVTTAGRRRIGDHVQRHLNVIAARRDIVESVFEAIARTGMIPGHFSILPAMIAEFVSDAIETSDERQLVISLGPRHNFAIFLHRNKLEFYQEFVTAPLPGPLGDKSLQNLNGLGDELRSILDMYFAQDSDRVVNRVIFLGDFAANSETREYFTGMIGVPSHHLTLPALPSDEDPVGPGVLCAALLSPQTQPLMPPHIREKRLQRRLLRWMTTSAVVVFGITGVFHTYTHMTKTALQAQLAATQEAIAKIEASPGFITHREAQRHLAEHSAMQTADQRQSYPELLAIFKELSLTIPEYVTLTETSLRRENGVAIIEMDGYVRVSGFSPEIILAGYVDQLESSKLFQNVTVTSHSKRREEGDFDLSFHLSLGVQS